MRLINNTSNDSFFNMAVEEYFLQTATVPVVILWRNARTVVIGRNQNALEEVDMDFVHHNNIDVVRRLTGGGAVFHDSGNINFTVIQKYEPGLFQNYEHFTRPICEYLQTLGVEASFAGRNDLLIAGKKFSGNAQAVKNHNIMHHGTIMFDANVTDLVEALRPNPLKIASKSIKSVQARVTNIAEHLPAPMPVEKFYAGLVEMFTVRGYERMDIQPHELAEIQVLADSKYRTWDWNFGQAPSYTLIREELFEFGIVEVRMEIVKGHIKQVKIYGDFFGLQDISMLEQSLIGIQHSRAELERALQTIQLDEYIKGMSAAQLAELMTE